MHKTKTAGFILDANGGNGPGFDWARLGFSILVVLIHSIVLPLGREESSFIGRFPIYPLLVSILPLFFCLSGFLVTGSALRLRDTKTFLLFRILRIVPALSVEVTISALILGPLVTNFSLNDYFTDRHFFGYFGNIFGRIRFELPGVFNSLPLPNVVNGNLWTLHPEFECYGIMAALMLTRIGYSRRFMTLGWIAATIGLAAYNATTGDLEPNGVFFGPVLVYYFVTGSVAFHWRNHILIDIRIFAICLMFVYGALFVKQSTMIVPIPMTYIMIWIGMQKFPRIPLIQNGDYSYGIYLFSFPLQQTLVLSAPSLRDWWFIFPVSVVLSLVVAAASWHFIEKPALRLKKHFMAS